MKRRHRGGGQLRPGPWVRVLKLEKFGVDHKFGSSHGKTRIIRLAYYEDPRYVPLLRRAYES